MTLKGVDLSYAQTKTPPLTGFDFVVVKASQADFNDPMWAIHSAAVRKMALPLLAYHYGVPASATPISTQVTRFLTAARSADYLFLDQEGAMTDADAVAFLNLIRKSRECGLYHSASGFGGTTNDAQWVADYRDPTGSYPHKATFADGEFTGWDIWQYTDAGAVEGYAGDLDLNVMNPSSPLVARLRVSLNAQLYDAHAALGRALLESATKTATITDLEQHIAIQDGTITELNDTVKDAKVAIETAELAQTAAEFELAAFKTQQADDRVAVRRLLGIA